MITDSHCHLASHKFPETELPEILTRAKENGIHRLITLATTLEDSLQNIAISEKFPQVYTAIGIHPCDVHETPDNYLPELTKLASHPKCLAIGETGLDYFHPAPEGWTDETYHTRQRHFLRQHFQLAADLDKNIVIHTRDKTGNQSQRDAIEIYREFSNKVRAVFHCFLGPIEYATPILELGGLISFTGIATFKSAKDTIAAATQAPTGSFMLETDAPYLAPTPHRGKRNEPAFTLHTAQHIADLRNETLEELLTHTETTTNNFFKFS